MSTGWLLALLFDTLSVGICVFAVVRGGVPERRGATVNLLAIGATAVLRSLDGRHLVPADYGVLAVDVCVAAGFLWLGVTTIRFWPIWAAGFALADLFMSICAALLPHVSLFAYHTGLGIYAYLALGALALGTFRLAPHAEPHIRIGSRRLWLRHLEETS